MSGSYVALAVGVNSLTGGSITNALGMGPSSGDRVGGGTGSGVAAAADPFAPYRSKLAELYSGALQPGTEIDITKMPGYTQFQTGVLDPALEASKRSSAASGMLRSGNEQIALQQTAQKGYYGFMTDYLNRLAQGSSATNNPATAVGMGVNQGNLNDAAFMQGLGATATALKGIYGGSSTNNTGVSGPTFESDINTSGFYDTAPSDINMSGFYRAD
jgi:hypothetical protein